MKRKKVGKALAVILLIILFIVLGYLLYNYFYGGTKEQKLERKITKMTKSFYEDYYYDLLVEQKGSKNDAIVYLSNFADKGLKISFDSLKLYYDEHEEMNYTDFADCNVDKTIVKIFPKAPYSKKDYSLKVELSCELEEPTVDSKTLKKAYEDLNTLEGLYEVKLDENSLIKYSTLEEVNELISKNKTFVIAFGSPFYNESRTTISSFIDVSSDQKIETIYYIDIIKDGKPETDIRTKYSTNERNEVYKVNTGSEAYNSLLVASKEILPAYTEVNLAGTDFEGERTLTNSTYIYVERGVPISYTTGIPTETKDLTQIDQTRVKEVIREFYNKRKAN